MDTSADSIPPSIQCSDKIILGRNKKTFLEESMSHQTKADPEERRWMSLDTLLSQPLKPRRFPPKWGRRGGRGEAAL